LIVRSDAQFQNNVVYWGGRLDRQKNFNLVLRIAELLPEIQFHCWGESVIGDYQLEEAPVNVTINPPFNDIDELDFEKCDLWLYTSKWDGIPNLILEVGVREIPLVSTAVWGTEDILNKSNSWIVEDIDNEKVYCAEILSALSSAKERTVRAAVLKQDIITRHSKEKFSESIRRFFYQDLTHD